MPKFIPLDSKEKEFWLSFLRDQIKEKNVDPEFIPYLQEINSVEGICTTQSCAGHKRGKSQDDGHLRFRLSEKMMRALRRNVQKFYQCRNIGYVDLRYHPGRRYFPTSDETGVYEEIMINFLGLNRGREIFQESIKHIVGILKNFEGE
ncbi:unnamed protein product [marine sediment metagenome]|uniref:Uncharacterized protein n=1 Tax=marine sediment metagenome TaxID=412755 RepID=X1L2D6_9ZZZZ